jgi:hypothetical protein
MGISPHICFNSFATFTYYIPGYIETEVCIMELLNGFTVQLTQFLGILNMYILLPMTFLSALSDQAHLGVIMFMAITGTPQSVCSNAERNEIVMNLCILCRI